MSFTVVQSLKIFHMIQNSFAERLIYSLSVNKALLKFIWSFMASHFLSVSCVCMMKFLILWTQFTIGGGVRCYLRSPNFILYCQERLKRQQKITHLTCCLRIYLLTSQTDFST